MIRTNKFHHTIRTVIIGCLSLLGIFASGVARSAPADSDTEMMIVIGAGGTEAYSEQFSRSATQLAEVARLAKMPSQTIGPRLSENPTTSKSREQTVREHWQQSLESVKRDGNRPLWIVLIGHGTFTRGVAKFNLTGPDVSADELNEWLEPFQRPIVLINTTSASAPFINALSKNGRTIVSATQSGNEVNATRFAEFFATAIADPKSDLDHDDAISVYESVLAAASQTKQSYQRDDRLATEHALLDDNADALGTPILKIDESTSDTKTIDGRLARTITISIQDGPHWTDEQLVERSRLESQLDELRNKKSELDDAKYQQQLEQILVPLARLHRTVFNNSEPE